MSTFPKRFQSTWPHINQDRFEGSSTDVHGSCVSYIQQQRQTIVSFLSALMEAPPRELMEITILFSVFPLTWCIAQGTLDGQSHLHLRGMDDQVTVRSHWPKEERSA